MTNKTNHLQLIELCARTVLKAFDEYRAKFKVITRRAEAHFENQDWHGIKADSNERLDLYKAVIDQVVLDIKRIFNNRVNDKEIWASTKAVYSNLSGKLDDWELAETFFNSVTRRIFATVGVDSGIEFVVTYHPSGRITVFRGRPKSRSQISSSPTSTYLLGSV